MKGMKVEMEECWVILQHEGRCFRTHDQKTRASALANRLDQISTREGRRRQASKPVLMHRAPTQMVATFVMAAALHEAEPVHLGSAVRFLYGVY